MRTDASRSLMLEPGTGKAIELLAGQILRIEQVEGRPMRRFQRLQPARLQGVHALGPHPHRARLQPTEGAFLWRPAAPRAGAALYPQGYRRSVTTCCSRAARPISTRAPMAFYDHTNCHDIQSEAQRGMASTPDDVHDSFNFFMNTEIGADGRATITPAVEPGRGPCRSPGADRCARRAQCPRRRRHAHLQLLAEADPPYPCSRRPKPISPRVPPTPVLRSQRTPRTSGTARTSRPTANLTRDRLCARLHQRADPHRGTRCHADRRKRPPCSTRLRLPLYGDDEGAALRDLLFTWWEERYLGPMPELLPSRNDLHCTTQAAAPTLCARCPCIRHSVRNQQQYSYLTC